MLSENSQPLFAERGKRAERKMAYSLFRRCNFCTACALQIAFGSVESGTEFSLKTVVQSIHESPWLSVLTDNRPQSANTAVCLLGGVSRAYPPRNRTQWFTRRNTGEHRHCWLAFFSRLQKSREFLCQATVDTAEFVAVVSVDGNKRSNRAPVPHI